MAHHALGEQYRTCPLPLSWTVARLAALKAAAAPHPPAHPPRGVPRPPAPPHAHTYTSFIPPPFPPFPPPHANPTANAAGNSFTRKLKFWSTPSAGSASAPVTPSGAGAIHVLSPLALPPSPGEQGEHEQGGGAALLQGARSACEGKRTPPPNSRAALS